MARIKSDAAIKGAVITSGKDAFLAGADLMMVQAIATGNPKHSHEQRVDALYASPIIGFSGILRVLETCGKPVAAALPSTGVMVGLPSLVPLMVMVMPLLAHQKKIM